MTRGISSVVALLMLGVLSNCSAGTPDYTNTQRSVLVRPTYSIFYPNCSPNRRAITIQTGFHPVTAAEYGRPSDPNQPSGNSGGAFRPQHTPAGNNPVPLVNRGVTSVPMGGAVVIPRPGNSAGSGSPTVVGSWTRASAGTPATSASTTGTNPGVSPIIAASGSANPGGGRHQVGQAGSQVSSNLPGTSPDKPAAAQQSKDVTDAGAANPARQFVLKDGRVLSVVNFVTTDIEYVVKTDKGRMRTLKKDDVKEIREPDADTIQAAAK